MSETADEHTEALAALGEALLHYVKTSTLARHTNGASTAYYVADKDCGSVAANLVADIIAWAGPKAHMRPGCRERVFEVVGATFPQDGAA